VKLVRLMGPWLLGGENVNKSVQHSIRLARAERAINDTPVFIFPCGLTIVGSGKRRDRAVP
jgi:hypothetical protein